MSIFEAMALEKALAAMTQRAEAAEAELAKCGDEVEDLMAQRNTAEEELAEMKQPCVWRPNVETWHYDTGCHSSFDARFDYCPNCGHPVEVAEPVNGEWDGSEEEASRDWDNPGE